MKSIRKGINLAARSAEMNERTFRDRHPRRLRFTKRLFNDLKLVQKLIERNRNFNATGILLSTKRIRFSKLALDDIERYKRYLIEAITPFLTKQNTIDELKNDLVARHPRQNTSMPNEVDCLKAALPYANEAITLFITSFKPQKVHPETTIRSRGALSTSYSICGFH